MTDDNPQLPGSATSRPALEGLCNLRQPSNPVPRLLVTALGLWAEVAAEAQQPPPPTPPAAS